MLVAVVNVECVADAYQGNMHELITGRLMRGREARALAAPSAARDIGVILADYL